MNIFINIFITFLLIVWGGIIIMSPMMVATEGMRDNRKSILFAIGLLSYPVVAFFILYLFNLRYLDMSSGHWLLATGIVSAAIILLYGFPGMLLNLTRGIPNRGYHKAALKVFLDGKRVVNADPTTFETFKADSHYARDHQSVFYFGRRIRNADPASFESIPWEEKPADSGDGLPVFWKDITHVYYLGEPVPKADPKTYQRLKGLYGKDASHVYYAGTLLDTSWPARFRFLGEDVATDGKSVFVYTKRSDQSVDIDTFEVVAGDEGVFCRDRDHVYVLLVRRPDPLVRIDGADPLTFQLLERSYARDHRHVYYLGRSSIKGQSVIHLEGADPRTFNVSYDAITKSEARDGTQWYMYGKRVV